MTEEVVLCHDGAEVSDYVYLCIIEDDSSHG